jgi:large subunit ribosomal protein L11
LTLHPLGFLASVAMAPAKRVITVRTLHLDAGQAAMAKLGQALGQYGLNLVELVRTYNAATEGQRGQVVPAVVTIHEDRSFTLVTKTPPTSALLRRAAGLAKGANAPNGTPVATLTRDQLREVARQKLPDLNTDDLDAAVRIVAGTARSMGIAVTG